MRSFFVAASLAAAVLLGPSAATATAHAGSCAFSSASSPYAAPYRGAVDTRGGRPYYYRNPYYGDYYHNGTVLGSHR